MDMVRLSILDTYGVRWSRETFARDVLQNFFDAAADFGDVTIDVDPPSRRVVVRGPAEFDLDLLAYVGATTKRDGTTAGGFGEGFKICALVALRDFGASLRAGSGARALRALLDPVALGRELCYAPEALDGDARGSFVELADCDDALLEAFRVARDRFRHAENPRIGALVAATADRSAGFARSGLGATGELYYRRQERGSYRSWGAFPALTLLHDAPLDALEGDRDRRDLRPEPLAEAIARRLEPEGVRDVIFALERDWEHGSAILHAVVSAARERELRFEFPDGWLARDGDDGGLTALAERQGFKLAAAYLSRVGMRRPRDRYRGDLETRPPTPLERARFCALRDLYAELAGAKPKIDALEVFSLRGAAVAGQHLGEKVIIGAELLDGEFAPAASTVLHELCHEHGGETSPGFLGQLEKLIAAAVRAPEVVTRAQAAFAAAEPAPEPPAAEPAPAAPAPAAPPAVYEPEMAHLTTEFYESPSQYIEVEVIVPPAFPASEHILAGIERVAAALGVRAMGSPQVVYGDRGAHEALAPGVPTVRVGALDCERGPVDVREPGRFALRLYDHDGELRPWPTDAQIEAVLRYGAARSARARNAADLRLRELGRARADEHLDPALRARLAAWRAWAARIGEIFHEDHFGWDRDLQSKWQAGRRLALASALSRTALDAPADAMRDEARALEKAWRADVHRVRPGWPPLDSDDAFEKSVEWAASGAALAARAAGDLDAAREAYGAVRALADRALAMPISFEARDALLTRVLSAGGLDALHVGALDLAAATARFDRVEPEVRAAADAAEERGHPLGHWDIDRLFSPAYSPEEARAASEAYRAREAARSGAVRAAWEGALAAGGSPIDAGEAALAEVRTRYDDSGSRVEVDRALARMEAHEAGDLGAAWRS